MKKLISVMWVLAILVVSIFSFTSCKKTADESSESTSKTETKIPKDKVKIGVIMYGYTDEQGKSTKEYCSYLEKNFNVEFVYESTNYNDDAHISSVENLISAGCKAIISAYDTSLESSIQTAEDAGVYYVLALDYDIESGDNALGYNRESGVADKLKALLEKEGLKVTRFAAGERFEGKQVKFGEITRQYDLMLYIANLATKSNQTTVRIEWMNPMGINCPIYSHTVPTIFVSVENPYHLLDVPNIKTYINCYSCNDFTLELLVEKLFGRSEFKGKSPIDPFCGRWDTKL